MAAPIVPITNPVDEGPGSGPPNPPGVGSKAAAAAGEDLGGHPDDAGKLLANDVALAEAQRFYRYARNRNRDWHDRITTLIEFAEGKQFATWGDDISHIGSRPKRDVTGGAIRHKTGLVSEPPLSINALPEDPEADVMGAEIVRAALEKEAERVDRREVVDEALDWAAKCGISFVHGGWDPVAEDYQEYAVDPRMVDPDPDQPNEDHWSYLFLTMRVPLDKVRANFPAMGKYVAADSGKSLIEDSATWSSSNDAANVAARIGKAEPADDGNLADPQMATIALMYSQGHWTEVEEDDPKQFALICQECSYKTDDIARAPDVMSEEQREVGDEVNEPCEQCGYSPLIRVPAKRKKMEPQYEKGRRLLVFAPESDVLLWLGGWPDPQIENWPLKRIIWYRVAGSWKGKSETERLWHLQLLLNQLLLLFSENAKMNATPKIILPRGIGFDHDPWTNIPSQMLVAKRPELIEKMKAFAGPDTPNSLIVLFRMVLEEINAETGFTDVALGQIRGNTEISGEAIKSAQSSAEVPVRHHLRRRYRLESQLVKDNLLIIQRRWSTKRWVRLVDPWGNSSVHLVQGDDLLKYDVTVTSEPDAKIDRSSTIQAVTALVPPGQPIDPLRQALLQWIGVPQKLLQAAMAKPQLPAAPGAGGAPAANGNGSMNDSDIEALLGQSGLAGGLAPQEVQ